MTGTHYEKIQEWKSGALYRMDTANGWESLEEADRKTNYDTTRINLVNPTNGGTSMLEIAYAIKSFRISDGAQSTEAGAWNGMTVEGQVALTIALALASNESIMRKAKDVKQKLEIDRVKLQRVLSGDDPVYKVHLIESEMDGQPRHIFEFELGKPQPQGEQATVLIECDNSNHITRTEIKNKKGQIRLRSARSKFDSQDVPHEYTLIEREQDAYITNKFFIKEAQLNADFSDDEVFHLAPPKDYGVVVDGPGGKPIIKSYPDGIKPTKIIDVSDIVSDYNSRRPGWKWILIGLLALIFIATLGHIGWKMVKRPR